MYKVIALVALALGASLYGMKQEAKLLEAVESQEAGKVWLILASEGGKKQPLWELLKHFVVTPDQENDFFYLAHHLLEIRKKTDNPWLQQQINMALAIALVKAVEQNRLSIAKFLIDQGIRASRRVEPYLLVDYAKSFGRSHAEMVELLEKSPIENII